jgi:TP901 family phage tail tape measure protein
MANNDINFYVIANTSGANSALERTHGIAQRIEKVFSKPLKPNVDTNALNKSLQPLGKFSSNFKEFEKSLDAATARVVAFTATTGLIYGLGNAFKRLTSDAIQVEAAVARIQGILKASDKDLASFTDSIFKLANNTGQGFYDAAKAAEEFARQGLSLQQTLKATESALILTRLSGTNLQDAMNGLVATVSSFSNELLDYGRVVNTLASIDAKFSTSAAGLVEGIKRVGSVASDAGVSFEELSSSIAAIRQITGRSESVIGNGLKTIFTNLQTEKVQQELAKLGIQTQKSTGEFLPLISVIDQLAAAFQNLNDSQRADLGQKVAGKYQINTFKALIQSFGGKDTSLFDQALQTAKGSQDEAIRRNELLNKTTLSTLNQLNNSITALGASFGDKVGKPLVDTLTKAANQGLEVLTGVFKDNPIGDFITGGIVSALKGPGIILAGVALAKLTKRIVFELTDAVKSVGGLNSRTQQNLKLDEAINNALKNGNAERVKAINLATTLEDKQREINALLRESYLTGSKSAQPTSSLASLVNTDTRKQVLKTIRKNAANGIIPAVAKEQNSIYNGVGGARKTARPVIANINMAGGSTPVVVNTDEHIIRNFANTGKDAVFNRNMTRQAGGIQSLARFGNVEKVMAGGYKPSILEAPFKPTTGNTYGLNPQKIDFIRQIAENISGARTKPVRFRKDLQDYGEFWPNNNNVFVHPDVISNKSPYYGGYSTPAHEYGHFVEYNSDPALMDLFKSAHKFDVKKKGSLLNQKYTRNNFIQTYPKRDYFSESFADTFAYSFLDRGDRNSILGGRAMSDLMRELIMKNIPVKSKANGFVPNFARSRFPDKDVEFLGLMDDLDLDNIGYTPGTGKELSDRSIKRGASKASFTRFTADRRNRIIKIEDTESFMKGDAFKNYSALADFAKRKDFIIKSAAFVKQGSRDNTKDKGIDLLYKLFPQLRYRDGVTKNTSGKYHIGRSERKFSSFHDLKSQVGQLSDSHIRTISKFSDIQDNFAGGLIPNFAMPKSKRDIKAEKKQKVFDYITSSDEFPYPVYTDVYGKYNKDGIKKIRKYNRRGISNQEDFIYKSNERSSLAKSLAFIRKAKDFNVNNPTDSDLKFLSSYYDDNANFDFTTKIRSQLFSSRNEAINLDKLNSKPNKLTEFYEKIVANTTDDIANMDFEDTMGTPIFREKSQKLRDLNQISSQVRGVADSLNIDRNRAAQHLKLKTVKNKDKLSELALKKVIRNERRISDKDQKKDPMGLKFGRDSLESLNKTLINNGLNPKFINPNYMGLDKINFLSESVRNPYYLEGIKNHLQKTTQSQIFSNPDVKQKNVANFLQKKYNDKIQFIQNIDGKIYDEQIWGGSGFPSSSTELWNEMVGDKTARYIEKKIKRQKNKITPGKSLNERLEDFKLIPFLERNSNKHIGRLIYESIKGKRRGTMAPQDPVGAQLALGNETIKEKLGFNPESLYGFGDDIDKAKYYFRGSSLDSFAIQNQLGEFTSSGFSNSDRVLGTNVSSSLLKAVGYAMSTGNREERPGLVGIYDGKKSREYSNSLPSPYSNEKNNTLKFGKLAEENLIAYFDPVSGRVLPKNNSLITGRKVDPYKVDYTKKLLEEGNILTKQYENLEKFKSDDSINLYRKLNISRNNTTLKGVHAPEKIFDGTQQPLPRSIDDFIGRLRTHTSTPQPGFISFGQESSSFFDLRSFRPISRDERKRMGESKALEQGSDHGKSLIYKKQVKSSDLVDMATLEALKGKTPEEIQEFFSKDRIYDLDSILGKGRGFESEREFTAFTTKPKFNIGKLIAKSAANGIIPNFANPLKDSISREYDALSDMGYPSYIAKNSIKVGSHDRLKSDKNPRGLGVYNTAQGQMSLGQALGQHAGQSLSSGIIPNFADLKTSTEKTSSKNLGLLIISTKRLSNSFSYLGDYLSTSFLSSLRKTTGSIIDISDTTNKKFKGIIDPTNIPSNKNAALVDPTGQPYGKSETARRLGLPVPGPITQKAISSNIVGLPASFNTGKSVNYRELARIPFDSTMIGRLRETETRKKSEEYIEKNIQKTLTQPVPFGNIQTVKKGGSFAPNLKQLETVTKLGVPFPTPILNGGLGSPTVELPPILRNKVKDTKTPPREAAKELLKRLGVPVPGPVAKKITNTGAKAKPPILSSPWQPPPQAAGPWVPYPSLPNPQVQAKREADLMRKNNEAINKQINTKIKEDALDKQLRKEARIEERKNRIKFLAEKKVSGLQYGGPQELLNSTLERLGKSKSLDPKFISTLQQDFEKRQVKAFEALTSKTGIFTSDKRLNSIAKKLNISTSSDQFIQRREDIKQKRVSGIQTGAFALPFVVGGIANTLGGQGSTAGRVTSGVGEALGTGLLLSQFGPLGAAVGIATGAFQILSTVVKELPPNLEELSNKSRDLSASNERQLASMQSFIETSNQLETLINSGASPDTISQARMALSQSAARLSGNEGSRLLQAKTDTERSQIIQSVSLENQRKQATADTSVIAASLIEKQASGVVANLNRIFGNSREFLGSSDAKLLAGELAKSIDITKISSETLEKAKSGKASLKDLGLADAETGKIFDNINQFFNNGTKNLTGASEAVLGFVQSLLVSQKTLDDLSKQQVEVNKIFTSTKQAFVNILNSTFASNQVTTKGLASSNEIGFIKTEGILSKMSETLSPEAMTQGLETIRNKKIENEVAVKRVALTDEYINNILESVSSQASNASSEKQVRIQDILKNSVSGDTPFDPDKVVKSIQDVLGGDSTDTLTSDLLKTSIDIALKLEDTKNIASQQLESSRQQTEIEKKQLSDTRLINILGGFSSNFRDVLRSIKTPKGGLTTISRGESSNNFQFGPISNIGGAKIGSMTAVERSQQNIETATNRINLWSDIDLPKEVKDKLNERNRQDLTLAAKSNVENRALAFGQSEILPQFDIIKKGIAGNDTGSIARKALDKQFKSIKQSFELGQAPIITDEFIKTIQSIIPKADKNGSIQAALDSIITGAATTSVVMSSADKSAKALADKTLKSDKLPPGFEEQIKAIDSNTSSLMGTTLSLSSLDGTLKDLPSKLTELTNKSSDQIQAFGISDTIRRLQSDIQYKSDLIGRARNAEQVTSSAVSLAAIDYRDESNMGKNEMERFLQFKGQVKAPSTTEELNLALKSFITSEYPSYNQKQQETLFKQFSDDRSYTQLMEGVSKDSLFFNKEQRFNPSKLQDEITTTKTEIDRLSKKLEGIQAKYMEQPNTTTTNQTSTQVPNNTVNISFNGVGSVDPNKVRDAVYSALANINRENNLPPPIQRPVSNTLVA